MDEPQVVAVPEEKVEGPFNDSLIAEVQRGLYIGSLRSILELRKQPHLSWLVVSVVHAPLMLQLVHNQLQELKRQRQKVEHIVWKLPDKSDAHFVGKRLEQVLQTMDMYVLKHPTTTATTNGSTAATDSSITNTATTASDTTENTRACLVHCALGISRSASVVAAWLLTRQCPNLQVVMDQLRQVRPSVQPNLGFVAGLRAIEQCGGVNGALLRLQKDQKQTQQKSLSSELDEVRLSRPKHEVADGIDR